MNAHASALVALSFLLVPSVVTSTASAQDAGDRRLRLGAHLALGFGGDADIFTEPGGGKASSELDPTIGFGARAELPIFDFVTIGGLFEAAAFESEVSDREWAFDFDGFARVRYVIELPDAGIVLEPYVLLPLGFTFVVRDDLDGDGDEAWPGWNTGVLAGLSLLTSSGIGGFLELGWRHHEVYSGFTLIRDFDVSLVTNQFALNLGFVMVL